MWRSAWQGRWLLLWTWPTGLRAKQGRTLASLIKRPLHALATPCATTPHLSPDCHCSNKRTDPVTSRPVLEAGGDDAYAPRTRSRNLAQDSVSWTPGNFIFHHAGGRITPLEIKKPHYTSPFIHTSKTTHQITSYTSNLIAAYSGYK